MQKKMHTRRGIALILVLTIIMITGVALSVLAAGAAGLSRNRQGQRVVLVGRSATDSAAAYARRHLATWSAAPPEGDIQLNIDQLLPEGMTGACVLSFPTGDQQRLCRITVHVVQHTYGALETLDLPLNPPPATATVSEPSP